MTQDTPLIGVNDPHLDPLLNASDEAAIEFQKAFDKIEELKKKDQEKEEEVPAEEEKEFPSDTSEEQSSADKNNAEEPSEDNKKTKWDVKKEKYRLIEEREKILEENKRLKEALQDSVYEGTYEYGRNAYNDLGRAIQDKKLAIEEGDTDALIKADLALNKAQRSVEELERWFESEKLKERPTEEIEQHSSPSAVSLTMSQQELLRDWIRENPVVDQTSLNFNPEVTQRVVEYSTYLENYLHQHNLDHYLLSPEYFDNIENFIEQQVNNFPSQGKVSNSSVAAVNRRGNVPMAAEKKPPTVTLTADEKRMARNSGVSEQEWLKYKIEELKTRGKRYG